ncbi:MAG TPA: hypothetical protein VFW17_15970 [Ktedonobacterales bacterium]|nr:hypothetical protein [Ktedonobacterales bacterium]
MSAHNNESWSTAPIVPVLTGSATEVAADYDLGSLRQEIQSLRRRQQDEIKAFRAEMAAEIASLEVAATSLNGHAPATAIEQSDSSAHPTSRRTLLKWGGVGAAAALAAAGGTALQMPTAHAANGANLVLGSAANTAENLTQLTYDGSETKPTAFKVSIGDNGLAIDGTAGNYNTGGSAGVSGTALNGAQAVGVAGKAGANGTGVYGVAKGSAACWGVWGFSDAGVAVEGGSGTGIDLMAGGAGRLASIPQLDVGAPTSGTYAAGEQIRDFGGNLFICVAGGSPGTWLKVAAAAAGRGGMVNLLSAPIRLLDTRLSIGKLSAGSVYVLQVSGVDVGGISVPKGATGVVGNVTVVQPTGGGDLRLYPGGAPQPATSSINFASGQVVANGVTVGLNISGQISIKVDMPAGTATHVIFDASGYVM